MSEDLGDDMDPALIDESIALLSAFREIKSSEVRQTVVWLAQSLAEDGDGQDLLRALSASAPKSPRPRSLS